ncbi:hypothetical protein [Elongatibacter sediminis]|uniref:Glycosyltransferase RgtA/B/C/D-like domain-containing protein n=1 Tax=Elongatibacter sediminis TaxID=3119006 RepID=A0AAW9R6A0_9GAMM
MVPDQAQPDHRPARGGVLALLAVTLLFSVVCVWMVTPAPPAGFHWDDTWYLLMAEWLSMRPDTWELAWTMLHLRQYPPLFPFVLSLAGAGLGNTGTAYLLNAVILALAGGLAMFWFRVEGFALAAAVFGGILVVFNPVALHWLPALFSEHLYLLLTTAVLLLAALRRDWMPLWLVLGILLGLAVATRTTGWALVGAITVHLVIARKPVCLVLTLIGLTAGWLTIPYLMVGLPDAPGYLDQFTELPYEPGVAFLVDQALALFRGWSDLWGSTLAGLLVLAFALPGWWLRLRKNRPDAWYVPAYVAILLAWPYPEHMNRFLWPLVPSVVVAVHAVLPRWRRWSLRAAPGSLLLAIVVLATVPDGLYRSVSRLVSPPPTELSALSRMNEWTRSGDRATGIEVLRARQQLIADAQRIGELTSPAFCVYSELPALITAQAGRMAVASPWENLQEAADADQECPYYYLIPSGLPGSTPQAVRTFGAPHEELFRSFTRVGGEEEVLGIFYSLVPPSRSGSPQ